MKAYADIQLLHAVLSDEDFRAMGSAKDCERMLHLASRKIDEATFNRIRGIGFERLTPFQKECVREACCYQAFKISQDGAEGADDNVQSYSVGDISITAKQSETAAKRQGLSELAYSMLEQSGLMQRGI